VSGCFFPSRKAAFYLAREAGAAVFGLEEVPVGRSLWGKPGLGGFEPARGEAPIEAGLVVKYEFGLGDRLGS
jgi:hypothetical protein